MSLPVARLLSQAELAERSWSRKGAIVCSSDGWTQLTPTYASNSLPNVFLIDCHSQAPLSLSFSDLGFLQQDMLPWDPHQASCLHLECPHASGECWFEKPTYCFPPRGMKKRLYLEWLTALDRKNRVVWARPQARLVRQTQGTVGWFPK